MAVTENFGWPLPDETATVREEMERLRDQTLPAVDADVHALEVLLYGKADDDHVHAIGDVTGLTTALSEKMPASATFAVGDLTDVVGADAAPDGYVLVKVGEQWVAQAAAAAIGAHSHLISDVSGLEEFLQQILSDPWSLQPIGVPIPVVDDIVGVAAPPTNKAYRYVKLTASDAYNSGVLISESIAGSAPNVTATAIVSLSGSPVNGRTVSLINTDRRFLRGGSAGTKEQSQNLAHAHIGSTDTQGWHGHTGVTYAAGDHQHYTAIGPAGGVNYGQSYRIDAGFYGGATANAALSSVGGSHQHSLAIDGNGSHAHTVTIASNGATEARPSNLGVTYYMRIK